MKALNEMLPIIGRAPLRIGLGGGGTDVSPYCDEFGGYVFNATISVFCFCLLTEPESSATLTLKTSDLGKRFHWTRATPDGLIPPAFRLHVASYKRFIEEFNKGEEMPLTITTWSEAPYGSGLGASSTMVVSILVALKELFSTKLSKYELARLAYTIERTDCKLLGGQQDQYAASFGGFNFMEFGSQNRVIVNPLRLSHDVEAELQASLTLVYSGVSRDSGTIIQDQLKNLQERSNAQIDFYQAMHAVKAIAVKMKEALLEARLDVFGDLLLESWRSKQMLSDMITNETIDSIINRGMSCGATAAKVSGAGGGGVLMFFSRPEHRESIRRALNEEKVILIPFSFTDQGASAWQTLR